MKETELRAEQQVSKIYESEIVSVGFLTDEEGEDFAQVSVQVSYDQKTSIKDLHDRIIGEPGEFVLTYSCWTFETHLPELEWKIVHLK
mmetsp:Transcript_6196/g.21960  ORF Transcript_6196/g.21960 Transcript_6196/m.21960 type:complete len:88 (+) Transcript_6196:293-556(+)